MKRLDRDGLHAATPALFLKAQLERFGPEVFRNKINGSLGTEKGTPMGKYVLAEVITGDVEAWRKDAAGQTTKLLMIAMDELHHYSLLRAVQRGRSSSSSSTMTSSGGRAGICEATLR